MAANTNKTFLGCWTEIINSIPGVECDEIIKTIGKKRIDLNQVNPTPPIIFVKYVEWY